MTKSNPIGVFDSGIGGLTVVKQIKSFLPNENIVYFGDTARVPYGSKSNATVIEYALQDAQFLLKKNVKLIVVACNTVSSVALQVLRDKINLPIIGMITPGAKMALKETANNKIGVIGTYATVNNKAYSKEIKKFDKKSKVFEKACPLFVPFAEEGWLNTEATKLVAKEYLKELKEKEIESLILGCTHYPLLHDVIQEAIGDKVKLIDSGIAASFEVREHLQARNLLNDSAAKGEDLYFVSDLPEKFRTVAELFLGKKIQHLQKIDLEEEIKNNLI
jgi:glutamate racemase